MMFAYSSYYSFREKNLSKGHRSNIYDVSFANFQPLFVYLVASFLMVKEFMKLQEFALLFSVSRFMHLHRVLEEYIIQISTENFLVYLIRYVDWKRTEAILNKSLQQKCFTAFYVRFLRRPFLQGTSWRLPLYRNMLDQMKHDIFGYSQDRSQSLCKYTL